MAEPETTPDEKVAQAKALLVAATLQRRREYQSEVAAHLCQCGHRRDQHTETTSINYTEGMCMVGYNPKRSKEGCQCKWFLFDRKANG